MSEPEKPLQGLAYHGSNGAVTCVLCDVEMDWVECTACGGDGYFNGYEEDPNWYQPDELVDCCQCGGEGGEFWCQTSECKTLTCTKVITK